MIAFAVCAFAALASTTWASTTWAGAAWACALWAFAVWGKGGDAASESGSSRTAAVWGMSSKLMMFEKPGSGAALFVAATAVAATAVGATAVVAAIAAVTFTRCRVHVRNQSRITEIQELR